MIHVTRSMLQGKAPGLRSLCRAVSSENKQLRTFLEKLKKEIENGAGTAHIHRKIEEQLWQCTDVKFDDDI
jgi:hypothetical protein